MLRVLKLVEYTRGSTVLIVGVAGTTITSQILPLEALQTSSRLITHATSTRSSIAANNERPHSLS